MLCFVVLLPSPFFLNLQMNMNNHQFNSVRSMVIYFSPRIAKTWDINTYIYGLCKTLSKYQKWGFGC